MPYFSLYFATYEALTRRALRSWSSRARSALAVGRARGRSFAADGGVLAAVDIWGGQLRLRLGPVVPSVGRCPPSFPAAPIFLLVDTANFSI